MRHPVLPVAILAVLCTLAYAETLSRPFVSEDFLFLREAARTSIGDTIRTNFGGPLLGVTFVSFYRPLAQVLYHVEYSFWGTAPTGYLLVQLVLHLLNTGLVYRLVERWAASSSSAWGVALVFALYPLHPNVVVFVAALPALAGATLLLLSLSLHERFRETSRFVGLAIPVFVFALATCTYEQTVILPALIVFREALLGDRRLPRRVWLGRLAPYFGVLVAYGWVRYAALGQLIGGYAGFFQRFVAGDLVPLARDLFEGMVRMFHPAYDDSVPDGAWVAIGVVLLAGTLWSLFTFRRRCGAQHLWLFGGFWILTTWAPFAYVAVVPGNGRYWYLTSIGLGLLIVAATRSTAIAAGLIRLRISAATAVLIVTGAFGCHYFFLLTRNLEVYGEAGRTAKMIQQSVAELHTENQQRNFVVGHPSFIKNTRGTPVAQVFHWGLADALEAPFVHPGVTVYPMPLFSDDEILPVVERADLGAVWRWNPASSALVRVAATTLRPIARLASRDGLRQAGLRFRPASSGRHRLVLVTRGNSSIYPIAETPASDGWIEVRPPEDVVCSMHRLYEGESYAWVEAREGNHRLSAVSRLHEIHCLQRAG